MNKTISIDIPATNEEGSLNFKSTETIDNVVLSIGQYKICVKMNDLIDAFNDVKIFFDTFDKSSKS